MAEYYPLLARAVSAQPNASKDTRDAIYERARKALLGQLRTHEPPLPEADIEREAHALDEAIARVEAEQFPATAPLAPESPPASKAEAAMEKPSPARVAPAARPMSLAERAKAHRASLAAGAKAADAGKSTPIGSPGPDSGLAQAAGAQPPKRGSAELRAEKALGSDAMAPLVASGRSSGAQNGRAPIVLADAKAAPFTERRAVPRNGLLWKFGRSRVEADSGPIVVPGPQSEHASFGLDANGAAAAEFQEAGSGFEPDAQAGEEQFRSEPARPLAPLARSERRTPALFWGLGSAVAVIVAGVAVLAFLLRDAPQTIENDKPTPVVAEKAPGKIVDRIGIGPTRMPDAAAGAGSLAPGGVEGSGSGASGVPAQSVANGASSPLGGTSAAQAANASATAQNAANAAVAVAQRAALLVQSPTASDPQAIATYLGTVVWRLDTVSQGAGQPVALAVRAEIDVPDARFKASMLIEKNTDESLPASHTIELRFMPGPGSVVGDVKQIDTPQLRKEESPAGDPLSGIPTPITANYFLVGLTKGDPAQARNIDLMGGAGWFDVPMLLANGKIAKITFEKGVAGQKALSDAFASWSN